MDLNGIDRCLDCMEDKSGTQVCPHCGRDERAALRSLPYLPYGIGLNDQYVLGRVLGHGGFGITYLAWDTRLDTRVALKEYLPRDFGTRGADGLSVSCFDGEAVEMFAYGRKKFLEEAQKLARFADHPGIVSVLNYFEAHGSAYMVMQYVEGTDLKQHLAQVGGRLPVDTAMGIITPVLDALRAVHAAGLLHRDMSPDNIYLTAAGRVLILDFGAAKDAVGSHSQSQALIRKPGYSPEEQYRTKGEQGPWTDVYAAAATLYHMLTGETPPEALDRLADDTLRPPSQLGVTMSPERELALMKALAVRAPDRYQSVADFQNALMTTPATPAHDDQAKGADRTSPSLPKPEPRGLGVRKLLLSLLVLLVLGALGWLAIEHVQDKSEQEAARLRHEKELAQIEADRERARREAAERQTARLQSEQEHRAEAETQRLAEERARQEQEQAAARARREREEQEAAARERQRREHEEWLAEQRRQEEEAEAERRRRAAAEAARCPAGYLNGTQIGALLSGRTAYGVRVGTSNETSWKEYQGSNGIAYFQKEGKGYITGKWKVSGDTACWCYGDCREYGCKRVLSNQDCTEWYYEDPITGERTGRIYQWVRGDKTG